MTKPKPAGTTYNLLFVCTGNTCRSPMAAAIAQRAVEQRGWQHVAVKSAGTGAAEGSNASAGTLTVLREHGIELGDHFSTPLTDDLINWADLILAMSVSHVYAVTDLGGSGKVALITDFIEGELSQGIEDPYGMDVDAYRRTYEELDRAIKGVLDRLEPILAP